MKLAPEPNTNYKTQLYLYKQRKEGNFIQDAEQYTTQLKKDCVDVYYANKDLNAFYNKRVDDKVEKKLLEYEKNIEKRRKKY